MILKVNYMSKCVVCVILETCNDKTYKRPAISVIDSRLKKIDPVW